MARRYGTAGLALSELADHYGLPPDIEDDLNRLEDEAYDLAERTVCAAEPKRTVPHTFAPAKDIEMGEISPSQEEA